MISNTLIHCCSNSPSPGLIEQGKGLKKCAQVAEIVLAIALATIGTLALTQIIPLPCPALPITISGWAWVAASLLLTTIVYLKNRGREQVLPPPDKIGKKELPSSTGSAARSTSTGPAVAVPPPVALPSARPATTALPTAVPTPTAAPLARPGMMPPPTAVPPPVAVPSARPVTMAPPTAAPKAKSAAAQRSDADIQRDIDARLREAHGYIDRVDDRLVARCGDITKAQLKEDFNLVLRQEQLSPQQKLELINKMLEALPYFLGEKTYDYSIFPLVGIPNYTGNNCFLNSDLQALVHSRAGDYLLLRPVALPDPLPEPVKPSATKPSAPNWTEFEMDRTDDRRKAASRKYDAEVEAWETAKQQYPKAQYAYTKRCREIDDTTKNNTARAYLCELVWQVRAGKAPSRDQMRQLSILVFGDANEGPGDSGQLLKYAHIVPERGMFSTAAVKDKGALESTPWSVVLYGCGHHLTAIVKTAKGLSWIDDSRVSPHSIQAIKDAIKPSIRPDGLHSGTYTSPWQAVGLSAPHILPPFQL